MTNPRYGIIEIGEFPEEWKIKKLDKVIQIIKGSVPSEKLDLRNNKVKYPYLSADYLRGNIKTAKYFSLENEGRFKLVENNDILLIWDGSNAGEFFMGRQGVLSSTMVKLTPISNDLNSRFLYYFLKRMEYMVRRTTKGSTIPHVNGDALLDLDILVPSLIEQKKIDEILSSIDLQIEKVAQHIEKAKSIKSGLMHELVSKGIGHTNFKRTKIGNIPEEWAINSISDLKESMFYGVTAKRTEERTDLRFLRTTDISNFKFKPEDLTYCEITESKENLSKYYLKENDIIVARAGTVGVSVLVENDLKDTIFGSYLIKIVFKRNLVNIKYIYYYFQSNLYWKKILTAQGSTIKNINLPFLNSLLIPIPSLTEQQKIAEILSETDKYISTTKKYKAKLERVKRGLMRDLLTGNVRVNNITEVMNENGKPV